MKKWYYEDCPIVKKCDDKSCQIIKDIIINNVPVINLDSFNKNKTYIIFIIPKYNSCHEVIEYFKANKIKYTAYDLTTFNGLIKANYHNIIGQCLKGVPVILEDLTKNKQSKIYGKSADFIIIDDPLNDYNTPNILTKTTIKKIT